MSAAAIDLRNQPSAIAQIHRGDCAYGRRALSLEKAQTKKGGRLGRFVPKEVRGTPLVGAHKIQSSIAINIGDRDASTNHRFGQSNKRSNVVVSSISAAHEERIRVMPTQIRTRSEAGPEARIVDDLVVTRAERLQLGPAIDFALNEPARLNCFQHAVIIKIGETCVPGKAAAG